MIYHRNVWNDGVVESSLLNVLRNKVALFLDDVECQPLLLVSKIVFRQRAIVLCGRENRGGEGER